MTTKLSATDCAICYVTDRGFLFPTIASALSLRRFVPTDVADVLLFLTGEPTANHDALVAFLADLGIKLLLLDAGQLDAVDAAKWSQGHVSLSTLGRFLIADTVARSHRRMLYVDGDTWFDADPTSLLQYDIMAGRIGAVDDIRAFSRDDVGRFGSSSRSYFADLGMAADQRYFNAGVLLVETATWREMAREALDFFMANTALCVRHDQSAMNAVLGRRRVALPIRLNFMTEYENLGLAKAIRPAIYHFTGSSKPWVGAMSPWTRFHPYYEEVERRIGHLVPRPTWNDDRARAQDRLTRRRWWKMHLLFAPRVFVKRRAIIRAERAAVRAFES